MGNFNNSLNRTPDLIEINLGFPDFRFRSGKTEKLSFFQVEALVKALPKAVQNIGMGGSPLRFEWWKELVVLLSSIKKNVVLVEKISQIDTSRTNLLQIKGIKLFLEVESLNQVGKVWKFKDNCEMFLISLGKIYKNMHLLNALKKTGVPFNIETITWQFDDDEIKKISQFLDRLGRVNRKCEIVESRIIGLGLDGTFYPCVALQFPEFRLGNIFNDGFDKIVRNYLEFKGKLRCQYCCQARSWSKYKALNQDFLCCHQCRKIY